MDILNPKAIIGCNSWGSALYGKVLRGSSVDISTIRETVRIAKEKKLLIFDLAQDYGLGKAQKMIGEFGTDDIYISSKFTPSGKYQKGQVRKSLEKDLNEFKRKYVDIYWLHLPSYIEDNLKEIIELYHEGKIHHIGISNFNLEECKKSKEILDKENIKLYGVQNHYSIISREWEKKGVVQWCHDNNIQFWAWAVLEEGMLVDPNVKTSTSIMKVIFSRKKKRLHSLYELMGTIAKNHNITIPQVAMAFCSTKGIIPICGCRRPYQVEQLYEASNVTLSPKEIEDLEKEADKLNITILGADMFRFAVKNKKK